MTSSILDRVLHHVDTLIIEGKKVSAPKTESSSNLPAATMLRTRPPGAWQHLAISDEAAAYIAEVLTQLAPDFEAAHLKQIRRHCQSIRTEHDEDPREVK